MAIPLRRSELILLAYFSYASLLALVLDLTPPVATVAVGINLLSIGGMFLLAFVDDRTKRPLLGGLRGFFPLPLVLLAYREMGWFARPIAVHDLENGWIYWDRLALPLLRPMVEVAGPLLPSILEIAYSLASPTPLLCAVTLTILRLESKLDMFWFSFLLSTLTSYALFPYFPSEPPRTIFPFDNVPTYDTIFRRLNFELLGAHGIHTSVFPSAHVSAEFGSAIGLYFAAPQHPRLWKSFAVIACLITVATVYGRYHYLVDALAGLGVSGMAWGVSKKMANTPPR